jgi:energy-coupling factor transport system ATP-binding protein
MFYVKSATFSRKRGVNKQLSRITRKIHKKTPMFYVKSATFSRNDHKSNKCDSQERESVVSVKNAWFRYEKNGEDVLKGLTLDVRSGELFCIVGGNGTGKTTALGMLSGLYQPYRGKVSVFGLDIAKAGHMALFRKGLAVLPQDPQTLFMRKTIREDLLDMVAHRKHSSAQGDFAVSAEKKVLEVAELTEITAILDQHPCDVSGGEQQRAALAKVLLTSPKLLLMDEPTKGMDSFFKRKFANILKTLREGGMTVIMVSHDLEFCAQYADRCALFFDGGIVTENTPQAFFAGNSFYTTAANRMSRHIMGGAITAEDVIERCKQQRYEKHAPYEQP